MGDSPSKEKVASQMQASVMAEQARDVEVPAPMIDLAKRRTDFLFRYIQYGDRPMREILASAYMQGMNDMFDVIERRIRR
jgi:hypothetical protein